MDFPLSGLLKDILAAFGNWPRWREIGATPERVDDLERRVAALEEAANAPKLPTCDSCGTPNMQAERTVRAPGPLGLAGVQHQHRRCGKCGYTDMLVVTPK